MRCLKSLVLVTSLLLLAVGCGGEQRLTTSNNQSASTDAGPDVSLGDTEVPSHSPDARAQPIETVVIEDSGEALGLFGDDGVASFQPSGPFQSVLIMVESDFEELSYRMLPTEGASVEQAEWQTLELEIFDPDFDPYYRQGLIVGEQSAVELQLRAPGRIDYATIEFFEERLSDDFQ